VDERRDAAGLLHVRDRVERDGGLAGGLGAVDLDDAAARKTANAESDVQGDGSRGDRLHRDALLVAQAHRGALAELPVDLPESRLERLAAICRLCHVTVPCVRARLPPAIAFVRCASRYEAPLTSAPRATPVVGADALQRPG